MAIKCQSTFDTGLYADCVECVERVERVPFSPDPSASYVSVGTYQLGEEGLRNGALILMKVVAQEDDLYTWAEVDRQRLATGVLDLKWHKDKAAIAMADGSLCMAGFDRQTERLCQDRPCLVDEDTVLLSLDWRGDGRSIVVSSNVGRLHLVGPEGRRCWNAHAMEVWHASFDRHDQNVVYSGSDDCLFKCWDTRDSGCPVFAKQHHTAGVCSVLSSPHLPHVLSTGSYDRTLCTWDRRALGRPLATISARSGVWRLKWHPSRSHILLAACMHDGFHVFNVESGHSVGHYPTDSLAYGCDWIGDTLVASCAFYNHESQLWSVSLQ